MGYFPESLHFAKSDEMALISSIIRSPDKVLKGYGGCHYIKRFGKVEFILDSLYRRSGAEEVEGLSSAIATDSLSAFMVQQYIVTDVQNKMHFFAKVNAPLSSFPDSFPVSIINGELVPSYIRGAAFPAYYEAFAIHTEFYAGLHEAELHIKHDPDFYGELDKVHNAFFTPLDEKGEFRSLSVKSLLKVKRVDMIPVTYNVNGLKHEAIPVAFCTSPIGSEIMIVLTASDSKLFRRGKEIPDDLYIWCEMILSLDPAIDRRKNGALRDEYNYTSLLVSSLIFNTLERLEFSLDDEVELFSGDAHIKGKYEVLDYLRREKCPLNGGKEFYKQISLSSDIDGIEKDRDAFAIESYPGREPLGLGFISLKNDRISRIMFRYGIFDRGE